MTISLTVSPSIEPLSYQDVLTHLRINPWDESVDETSVSYIESLITAVRMDTESFLNRALITQTWTYYLDNWPDVDWIELPKPPLQTVNSVTVLSAVGVPSALSVSYLVDTVSEPGRIILAYEESWPTDIILSPMNPIQIEFVCGYGDLREDIPEDIKIPMLLQIGSMYEHREEITEKPINRLGIVEMMLWPKRIKKF
jgi:uncharacterized phiE125 gp8 family phage protein